MKRLGDNGLKTVFYCLFNLKDKVKCFYELPMLHNRIGLDSCFSINSISKDLFEKVLSFNKFGKRDKLKKTYKDVLKKSAINEEDVRPEGLEESGLKDEG